MWKEKWKWKWNEKWNEMKSIVHNSDMFALYSLAGYYAVPIVIIKIYIVCILLSS